METANNPWRNVALADYEGHMSRSNVMQLQTLDRIMKEQFHDYPIESVAILGIAGGNGLGNLSVLPTIKHIIGIDINLEYLEASKSRYPELSDRYETLLADICEDSIELPQVDMVVANLFVEYVGCKVFADAVCRMSPRYVSCVIQIDPAESFVSDTPYSTKLAVLDSVHSTVNHSELTEAMHSHGYDRKSVFMTDLPNSKRFMRLDYCRANQATCNTRKCL